MKARDMIMAKIEQRANNYSFVDYKHQPKQQHPQQLA